MSKLNEILTKRLINNWNNLSEYAYKINLKGLIWEPMSIRESLEIQLNQRKK